MPNKLFKHNFYLRGKLLEWIVTLYKTCSILVYIAFDVSFYSLTIKHFLKLNDTFSLIIFDYFLCLFFPYRGMVMNQCMGLS